MRPNALVIIRNGDKILVQKGVDNKTGIHFCRPLGGGIEFGETSLVAIQREIKEEIGSTLEDAKLLRVMENIFEYNGKPGHEITFLYSGKLLEKEVYEKEKISILDKEQEYAEWVAVHEIQEGKITMYPKEVLKFI